LTTFKEQAEKPPVLFYLPRHYHLNVPFFKYQTIIIFALL